jgi:hypothetical protein
MKKRQKIKNMIDEVDDYEIVEQDEFIIGDRLANHWVKQIKPDAPSRYDRLYIAKVDNHLEIGYMKVDFLR